MPLRFIKYISVFFAVLGAAGCVNIKGLPNPMVPKELGNDRYIVGVGLQSSSDLTLAMFTFCDQQKKIYHEISNSGIQLTFACLDPDNIPVTKPTQKRHAVKALY